jgi:effector-binding domain-containing protein
MNCDLLFVRTFIILPLILLIHTPWVMAYESMHEKTPVGEIKILELPARTALEASCDEHYFAENNGLFRKLFGYISKHDLAMTTPVEADIDPGKMRFFVGEEDAEKPRPNTSAVTVRDLEPMTVVAIGIRGSYSEENFTENKTALLDWLKENPDYEQAGSAYAVYWDGPFIPWFLKRSEIHLPIQSRTKQSPQN